MSTDDKNMQMGELSQLHDSSIISQLIDIGTEENQQNNFKPRRFIEKLQCLQPVGTKLRRKSITARERKYVALSYTCEPSKYEDAKTGKYLVELWEGRDYAPSKVRDCVLDRALGYMRYVNVDHLWIDAHCICEDSSGRDKCPSHSECVLKGDAMKAMDLVYQCSKYPVALLGRRVETETELHLLSRLLSEEIVSNVGTNMDEAKDALCLLSEITDDLWWKRAWTFQENYRGGLNMKLLIPHAYNLRSLKRKEIFCDMEGELIVSSVKFFKEATKLCLKLEGTPHADQDKIDNVLNAAKRYKLVLSESSSMTPSVVADIEKRGSVQLWDRLAIIANCCQYTIRMDEAKLERNGHSLSLSVLTMCLLNGEILNNSSNIPRADRLTMSSFLDNSMFKDFMAPCRNSKLASNKNCRLVDVQITADGILTHGYIWKLYHVIDTSEIRIKQRSQQNLSWVERRLLLLLGYLRSEQRCYDELLNMLNDYLQKKKRSRREDSSFSEDHMDRMAEEIARAIDAGEKLRLGTLWDPQNEGSGPYRAIFVFPDNDNNQASSKDTAFVFTSAWEASIGDEKHDANDLDKFVYLEVNIEQPNGKKTTPHLRVRSWRNGMCFFQRCRPSKVVFPWPHALQEMEL